MKKIALSFSLSFVLINICFSQESNLYLLAAHPFYDADQFPSFLFKLNREGKSLDTIQNLSKSSQVLREVKCYPTIRKLVFVKDNFQNGNSYKSVLFLDMDAPQKLDSVNLDSLNYMYLNSWVFSNSQKRYQLGIDFYNSKMPQKENLLSIDVRSLSINYFNIDDLKQAEISGNTGACLLTFDGLPAYTNSFNGELRIPETSDTIKRPIFPIQLPKELQLHKKERRSIIINNEYEFVFSLKNYSASEDDLGSTDLAVLNKLSNVWFTKKIKGNVDYMIRSFDDWIAGTVYSDNKILDEKGRIQNKLKRVSPGKQKRRKTMHKTGMPADYRFDYFGVFSPGILYLLNVQTGNLIEWNTNQGDSEIILLENNRVFYRINDEIFEAPIIAGKKLGNPQLLLKNELVPDIHWAFFSRKVEQ
jgi:hypothetical protein